MNRIKSALDTSVLYPSYLRDFLLRLAILDEAHWTFEPVWSDEILRELARALRRSSLLPSSIDRLIKQMNHFFPDALTDYQSAMNRPSLAD